MKSLEYLRKSAKHWLREVRNQNPGQIKRLRLAYPGAPAAPGLRDIQHALAREHGYEGWRALKAAHDTRGATPARDRRSDDPVSRFLDLACWDHETHGRGTYAMREAAAGRLLESHPGIREDFHVAVVCGDLPRVSRVLSERAELARTKGGARGWEPLLYLCFARVPQTPSSQVEQTARVLLDHGADANAYYMAGDALYGTLVGVAGEGEQDAFPHPERESLYPLLLERGAEPFDIQVLYNTHFRGDVLWWLKATYRYTVDHGQAAAWADPDWPMFDMGGYGNGARFLFWISIQRNDLALATWLLEHGANPNAAPPRAATFSQRTLYDDALDAGCVEIAARLRAYGGAAGTVPPSDGRLFVAACMRLDRAAAEALLQAHPELRQSSQAMMAAVLHDRADVVALLLDLGISPNVRDEQGVPALHRAASRDARRVAHLLLEHGADPDARDAAYDGTALGFAAYSDHRAMMALLGDVSRDVRNLARAGYVPRLREVLREEPALAREVRDDMTPLWWLPLDDDVALEVVDVLLASGADANYVDSEGETAADVARQRGLDRAAARLARAAAGQPD